MEKVSVEFVGTGPAAAAYFKVSTSAALSLVGGKVPELIEYERFFPGFLDALDPDISGRNFKVSTRLGNPLVGDEHKAFSGKATGALRGITLFSDDTVIMRCTGNLHLDLVFGLNIIKPVKDIFVRLGVELFAF